MVARIKNVKWVIFGGDSQLAKAMSLCLKQSKINFVLLNRKQADITNQKNIEDWLTKVSPEIVLNTAAWTDVDLAEIEEKKAFKVNAFGPRVLAEVCSRSRLKLVHISTNYVFSGKVKIPYTEIAKTDPINAYGRTKEAGEKFILDFYPSGSYIVRTAWLYSPWGKNFVKSILEKAENNSEVTVVNDQIGQPTSATDLAIQIMRMVYGSAKPGIYHATNTGQVTWFEFAQVVFKLSGHNLNRIKKINSLSLPQAATRPAYSVLSQNNWINQGLYPMRSWQSALEDALPLIIKNMQLEKL